MHIVKALPTGGMRITAVLLFVLLTVVVITGEDTAPTKIQTSVREVVVDLVVHDKHGRMVRKLDPAEITIYDDGVKQDVRMEDVGAVAAGTPSRGVSPLRAINIVCIVFQDLTPETRQPAMNAALEFLKNELRPSTYIGVFTLDDRGVMPVYRFSNNPMELAGAIRRAAAGQISMQGSSSQQVFTSLNIVMGTVGTPPPLPSQAGG